MQANPSSGPTFGDFIPPAAADAADARPPKAAAERSDDRPSPSHGRGRSSGPRPSPHSSPSAPGAGGTPNKRLNSKRGGERGVGGHSPGGGERSSYGSPGGSPMAPPVGGPSYTVPGAGYSAYSFPSYSPGYSPQFRPAYPMFPGAAYTPEQIYTSYYPYGMPYVSMDPAAAAAPPVVATPPSPVTQAPRKKLVIRDPETGEPIDVKADSPKPTTTTTTTTTDVKPEQPQPAATDAKPEQPAAATADVKPDVPSDKPADNSDAAQEPVVVESPQPPADQQPASADATPAVEVPPPTDDVDVVATQPSENAAESSPAAVESVDQPPSDETATTTTTTMTTASESSSADDKSSSDSDAPSPADSDAKTNVRAGSPELPSRCESPKINYSISMLLSMRSDAPPSPPPGFKVPQRSKYPPVAQKPRMPPPVRPVRKRTKIAPPTTAEEVAIRKVTILLNKITPESFESISNQILGLCTNSQPFLQGIIKAIFNKALGEQIFCRVYAALCNKIFKPPNSTESNPMSVSFIKLLLSQCQREFEKANRYDELDKLEGLSEEEAYEATLKIRMRMLGNIKFIGELVKQGILQHKIAHQCLESLADSGCNPTNPLRKRNDAVEAMCNLLETIGKDLDIEVAKTRMHNYFEALNVLNKSQDLESRIRFRCKDVIEMRQRGWQLRHRKQEQGPKKISQLHEDMRKKELEEQAALAKRSSRPPRPQPAAQPGDEWKTSRAARNSSTTDRSEKNSGGRGGRGVTAKDARLPKHAGQPEAGWSKGKGNSFSVLDSPTSSAGKAGSTSPSSASASSSSSPSSSSSSSPDSERDELAAAAGGVDLDAVRSKIVDILKELYSSLEVEDAVENIRDLKLGSTDERVVLTSLLFADACAVNEAKRKLLCQFCGMLNKERLLDGDDWLGGLATAIELLPDTLLDAPLAPGTIARLVVQAYKDSVLVDWSEIPSLLRQSLDPDLWAQVIGSLISTALKDTDLASTRALLERSRMSNPVFFFIPRQRSPQAIHAFIDKYDVRALFPLAEFYADSSALLVDPLALPIDELTAKIQVNLSAELRAHPMLPHELVQLGLESIFSYMKSHPSDDRAALGPRLFGVVGKLLQSLLPTGSETSVAILNGTADYLIDEYPHIGLSNLKKPFEMCLHYFRELAIVDADVVKQWAASAHSKPIYANYINIVRQVFSIA